MNGYEAAKLGRGMPSIGSGRLDGTVPSPPMRPVADRLDQARKALAILHDQLSVLTARLDTVLGPQAGQTDKSLERDVPYTVASQLLEVNEGIGAATLRVTELIDRLEI